MCIGWPARSVTRLMHSGACMLGSCRTLFLVWWAARTRHVYSNPRPGCHLTAPSGILRQRRAAMYRRTGACSRNRCGGRAWPGCLGQTSRLRCAFGRCGGRGPRSGASLRRRAAAPRARPDTFSATASRGCVFPTRADTGGPRHGLLICDALFGGLNAKLLST
jgi:hypothetical protein